MSFAVIQMVSQSDLLANLVLARRLLEQAAAGGAKLAVLPENFAAMGRRDVADIGRAEALGEGAGQCAAWMGQMLGWPALPPGRGRESPGCMGR